MFGEWMIDQMTPRSPGFWLLMSLITGAAVLYLERIWPRARWRPVWAIQRVLIPYLGLVLGGLSPRLLGFSQIDWTAGLGIGLVLIFAVTMLLLLVRATVDLPDIGEGAPLRPPDRPEANAGDGPAAPPGNLAALPKPGEWWQSLLTTVGICGVREFHWVFLRGAIWELLLHMPGSPAVPGYWAVWLAGLVVLGELVVRRLSFAHNVFQVVTLICTGILYFYTLNFWLCWLLHTIAQVIAAPSSLQRPLPRLGRRLRQG